MVGSSHTYEDDKEKGFSVYFIILFVLYVFYLFYFYSAAKKVEVAVTGTAVPVLVNIQPSNAYDFGEVSFLLNYLIYNLLHYISYIILHRPSSDYIRFTCKQT